jgi:hypothetical protein
MKGKSGRRAVDGVTKPTARVNAAVTLEHKRRIEILTMQMGISAWLRQVIDSAWDKHTKASQ